MAEIVCWLNEDCIAGYEHKGGCRYPSWTAREQAICATCDLMDDGLPCEYHRGFADGAERAERAEAAVARVEALADSMCDHQANGDCVEATYRDAIRAALTGADQ